MSGQLSFFTAGVWPPEVDDLEGILAGPGQAVRRRDTARLSVRVDAEWRAAALVAACAERNLSAERGEDDGELVVRTPFTARLLPLAHRWLRGAVKQPPVGFTLDGARLRLWALAAGSAAPAGYLLRLGPSDPAVWPQVGAALAAAGVPAVFVGPRADGPGYRVVGRRRRARRGALVGEPPPGGSAQWPASGGI